MFPEFFFMILISPDSVRTKAQAYSFTKGGPASVYVPPNLSSGGLKEFQAIPMKEGGQLGLNVVMLGHLDTLATHLDPG